MLDLVLGKVGGYPRKWVVYSDMVVIVSINGVKKWSM